jgi:hypothetical protein
VDLPWAENLHQCWFDKITAEAHPLLSHKRLFVRRIKLAYMCADGIKVDWIANVNIWHRDAQWLADLPYLQMEAMLLPDSLLW